MIKINLATRKTVAVPGAAKSPSKSGGSSLFKADLNLNMQALPIKSLLVTVVLYFACDYFLGDYKTQEIAKVDAAVEKLTTEKKKFESEIARMKGYEADKAQLEKDEALIKIKLETVEKLIAGRQNPPKFLKYLSGVIPEQVWLTALILEQAEASFEGQAKNFSQVTDFMKQLNDSVYFKEADAKTQNSKAKDGSDIAAFKLTAKRREVLK